MYKISSNDIQRTNDIKNNNNIKHQIFGLRNFLKTEQF